MKNKFNLNVFAEIAIFSALTFALDILQGGLFRGVFPNGGSIGIAMLPIFIISYRRGFVPALLCGVIASFLQMLCGVYAIAGSWQMILLQILLDYIITYPLVAFAGLFYKSFKNAKSSKKQNLYICLGSVLGGLLKLLSHYLAGVIFWKDNCPADFLGGPAVYSLVYNGAYVIPSIIICVVILVIINLKQPFILNPNYVESKKNKESGESNE